MPVFPVKLAYNNDYLPMLYPDIPFRNNLLFEPGTLQLHGDVETIGEKINLPDDDGAVQFGKLLTPVKVTFTRFDVDRVFPVNSRVTIHWNANDVPKDIYLDTDEFGNLVIEAPPLPPQPPPMGGGKRRRSLRRRLHRRRNTRRHRRHRHRR
jgi:hypothetical protein